MKKDLYLLFPILLTLAACATFKKVHRLIDQRDNYIWTGTKDSKKYLLEIDSRFKNRFVGKILIDSQDTLYLEGFEKGNVHLTNVRKEAIDSINYKGLGNIFIWTQGDWADTVIIENHRDSIPQLPFEIMLLKKPKKK